MKHLPLTIFSLCTQAAAGIMFFVGIGILTNQEANYSFIVGTATCLAVLGLLFSLLHLGRPMNAGKSLLMFSTSWLSREIWVTSLFVGTTLVSALLFIFGFESSGLINLFVLASVFFGLLDIYVMASVYLNTSVPAWRHPSLIIESYTAAISIGALTLYALITGESSDMRQIFLAVAIISVIIQIISMISYYIDLGAKEGLAAKKSIEILNKKSFVLILKWLFILLSVCFLVIFELMGTGVYYVYISAFLMFFGQFIGRYLFYDTMIVTRVGLR